MILLSIVTAILACITCYCTTLRIVYIPEVNISFVLFYTGFSPIGISQHLPNQHLPDQHLPNLDHDAVESIKGAKQIH